MLFIYVKCSFIAWCNILNWDLKFLDNTPNLPTSCIQNKKSGKCHKKKVVILYHHEEQLFGYEV